MGTLFLNDVSHRLPWTFLTTATAIKYVIGPSPTQLTASQYLPGQKSGWPPPTGLDTVDSPTTILGAPRKEGHAKRNSVAPFLALPRACVLQLVQLAEQQRANIGPKLLAC